MVPPLSSYWVSTVQSHSNDFANNRTAGEVLAQSVPALERGAHPVAIIAELNSALRIALEVVQRISIPIDVSNEKQMLALIRTSIGTKLSIRWADLMCDLALTAVKTVWMNDKDGISVVDIKRYARIEKVSLCFGLWRMRS